MPRPPSDRHNSSGRRAPGPDAEWPSSITELQRQAQERAVRADLAGDDEARSTARLRPRHRASGSGAAAPGDADLGATRRAGPGDGPAYREPLDVRAGEIIVSRVRAAAGRAIEYLRSLRGHRLWTVVALALLGGAVVGGVAAFGIRRAVGSGAPVPGSPAMPLGGAASGLAPGAPGVPGMTPGMTPAETPGGPALGTGGRGVADTPSPAGPAAAGPAAAADPAARPTATPVPIAQGRALSAHDPATLVIISDPFGAEIAVNGQATGLKTPDSVEGLAPGRTYRVTLTRRGYAPWEQDVVVRVGGRQSLSAKLARRGRGRRR